MRYHSNIYFPDWARGKIDSLVKNLNWRRVIFSNHTLDKLGDELYPISDQIRKAINGMWLDSQDVFEFEGDRDNIEKVCVRLRNIVNDRDLILVINSQMVIITLYLNNSHDSHKSLDKSLYEKGE